MKDEGRMDYMKAMKALLTDVPYKLRPPNSHTANVRNIRES